MKGLVIIRRCTTSDLPTIEAIINEAAQVYRNAIPADCWHEPYMPTEELKAEIAAGVSFWGWDEKTMLVGVMGIQKVHEATLIQHAYVSAAYQGRGFGSALLKTLIDQASPLLLIGTWAAAEWAIRFY
jgi:GNAT superfamily N-acetyltransferase